MIGEVRGPLFAVVTSHCRRLAGSLASVEIHRPGARGSRFLRVPDGDGEHPLGDVQPSD